MKAYHFLKADMRSGEGNEPPWTVGESRTHEAKTLALCKRGYHSSPSWHAALRYAPGPVACIVEISAPEAKDTEKAVSRTRTLIAAANVEKELRLFACDCAERALKRERKAGREPSLASWHAVKVGRAFVEGKATREELYAAAAAAAADAAAYAAAADAAEIKWQRKRLAKYLNKAVPVPIGALWTPQTSTRRLAAVPPPC